MGVMAGRALSCLPCVEAFMASSVTMKSNPWEMTFSDDSDFVLSGTFFPLKVPCTYTAHFNTDRQKKCILRNKKKSIPSVGYLMLAGYFWGHIQTLYK